jgi:prevent-host-death family protein
MSQTVPLAEMKAHLSAIIDRVEKHHERVTITRNGRVVAVLMSPDDLQAIDDTIDLLGDPEARLEIDRARAEAGAGKVVRAEFLRIRALFLGDL